MTFLTRKDTLRRKRHIFRTYCWRNHDCSLWLSITKHSVFNPLQFLRLLFRDKLFAKMIAKSWLYGWPQILFGKTLKLWVPVPALATHLDHRALAPGIDWISLMHRLGGRDEGLRPESSGRRTKPYSRRRFTPEDTPLKPRCTVIVLNYNGEKLLPACLDSLALQTGEPIDTVIVDNASTDGSAALVAERYPWAVFGPRKNYGFTGANNAALRDALARGSESRCCSTTTLSLHPTLLPRCSR